VPSVKRIEDVPEIDLSGTGDVMGARKRVLIGPADHAPTFAVRLFTLEPGGHTPHHSHPFEHGVIVLEGEGEIVTDQGPKAIGAGTVAFVPPNERHQFRNTGEAPLRFLCIVPRHVEA